MWPGLKFTGAMATADTSPKYQICAKWGETLCASFAPARQEDSISEHGVFKVLLAQ